MTPESLLDGKLSGGGCGGRRRRRGKAGRQSMGEEGDGRPEKWVTEPSSDKKPQLQPGENSKTRKKKGGGGR